jgi:methyl-accepting chemotaxis protein
VTSIAQHDNHLEWIIAKPIFGQTGQVHGVVVGDLDPTALAGLLDTNLAAGVEVVVVDADRRLVFDSEVFAEANDDASLLAAGALQTTIDNVAVRSAMENGVGSARFLDPEGHDVIGGYDLVEPLGWALIVQDHAEAVLAPIAKLRERALLVVGIAALFAAGAAFFVGSREAKKLRGLAAGTAAAGVGVNSAAAQLSASSEELAATTTQQSAAVTQATATTEELARTSAAIAETVDGVARQTSETRDNLEQAQIDIELSSERTLALMGRVNDIDALRGLINEIADQTNMLALNAAIEAARAGEHGLGFAVVADEVRRLAERSKTSASDIAAIVTAVQGETNATVMAMEKGAKQMHQGLLLLGAVTDAAGQVRLTTQQQRSANAQVVETMEQLTQSSRQVSATAQQIASAAGDLADLAGDLETSAAATKGRY